MSRSMASEQSISYFDTRVDCGTLTSDNNRWASRGVNLQVEKVVEIWRRRSRMDRKHDPDTDEIWSQNARDKSNITPRLWTVCGSYSDIGGHEMSRIRDLRKMFRKINEQKVSFRLIEREVSWHPSWDIVDGSFEIRDVKREFEGRKWEKEFNFIGLERMLDRWIGYEWAKWSSVKNEKKRTHNRALWNTMTLMKWKLI